MPSLSDIKPKREITESYQFTFGQYKDLFVGDVLQENPSCILWLAEQDWCIVDQKLIDRAQELSWENEQQPDFSDTPWNPFD